MAKNQDLERLVAARNAVRARSKEFAAVTRDPLPDDAVALVVRYPNENGGDDVHVIYNEQTLTPQMSFLVRTVLLATESAEPVKSERAVALYADFSYGEIGIPVSARRKLHTAGQSAIQAAKGEMADHSPNALSLPRAEQTTVQRARVEALKDAASTVVFGLKVWYLHPHR